jgi:magnesium transporter
VSNLGRVAEWIDLLDPSEAELQSSLPGAVHDRALERLRQPIRHDDEPRPTIESHGDYVYAVFIVPVCRRRKDEVFYQEIDVLATHDVVLTVRKSPAGDRPFDETPIREEVAKNPNAHPGRIVFFVLDAVAEAYLQVVDELDDEIDDLEDAVETRDAAYVRERISDLRRHFLHIRRALWPTRDAADRVADKRVDVDGKELFPRSIELDFRDAYEKLLRAGDGLELSRDLLASVRDYLQAKIANDQNEVMKKLTVIASILLLPTFIVGLYGQNFQHHFPEIHWRLGYLWSWGLIVVTTLIQLWFFRRKRWI